MQFCKGAGCAEIAGMKQIQKKDNYTLVRPLLHLDKQDLYNYLNKHNIKFFEDASNKNEKIIRNSFRHNYCNPLLDKYKNGIKKSFDYLDEDRQTLISEVKIHYVDDFIYFINSQNNRTNIFTIDKILKSKNYMLSLNERKLLKEKETLIVGKQFIVNQNSNFIFISSYSYDDKNTVMTHEFKEKCRVLKITPKLRPFLFKNKVIFKKINELLS